MSNALYAEIPALMERFEFDKVHKVMEFLGWTWAGQAGTPSVAELEATAYGLLCRCINEFVRRGSPASGMSCATGGFETSVIVYENGKTTLQLLFYVDSRSSI